MTPTRTPTTEQIATMPTDELADALCSAAGGSDNARRGAVHALVGYNGGDLVGRKAVRAYIVSTGDGPLVQWPRLARHIADVRDPRFNPDHHATDDPRRGLARINSTGFDAITLACSLGDGTHAVNLRSMASRWGNVNRKIMAEAVAIAFGLRGTVTIETKVDPGE